MEYLGRGGLLEEEDGSWITNRRATIERARYRSRLRLSEAYIQQKQLGQAEAVLSLLLEEDPTDEDVVCHLMELFHQQGMTHQALCLYEQTCGMFVKEGMDVSETTKELARELALSDKRTKRTKSPTSQTSSRSNDVSLLSQSLKYAIIEAAEELGGTPIHSLSTIVQKGDMDGTKRDLLKLLGTSIVFAETGMDFRSFMTILRGGDRLEIFQHEMTMRWDVYHSGNTVQAHQGLHLWLDELEQFVKTGSSTKQVVPLLGISYQLHGSLFRDEMNYSEAHNAYRQAYLAADECDNLELKSASLARRSVAFIQQKEPIDAIQYLEYALTQIENHDFPDLLGYIYQALSEAHAMLQHQDQAQSYIHLAEQALTRKGCISEISNCSSNTTSVTAQKGVNAVLLKDYNLALSLLDVGLAQYDPTLRRGRARLIAQKAEAYYGLGLIDESTKTAIEALPIAQAIGSTKTIGRVKDLHSLLVQSRYRKETGVVQLGTMLTTQ